MTFFNFIGCIILGVTYAHFADAPPIEYLSADWWKGLIAIGVGVALVSD